MRDAIDYIESHPLLVAIVSSVLTVIFVLPVVRKLK